MKRKYKCIRQIEETDCGAACLATVCDYYGKSIDILEIRSFARVDRYGATMLGLYKASEKLGFQPEGLSGNIQDLLSEELQFPCIAHVVVDEQLEHYVVVFEINDHTIIVGDPAKGVETYSVSDFEKIWTGHILSLKPGHLFKHERKRTHDLVPFFKMAGAYKKEFAMIAFFSLCTTILSVAASFFNYYLIDTIIPYKDNYKLEFLAAAIIIGNIVILSINLIRAYIIANISKNISTDIMCRYIRHLLDVKYDFYDQHTSGDMISRLEDSNIVREAISKVIMTAMFDVMMTIVCLAVLYCLNGYLFILTLMIVICYMFSVAKFNRSINKISEEMRRRDAAASTAFFETVRGIETIKSYEYEEYVYKKNGNSLSKLMDSYKLLNLQLSKQMYLAEGIVAIGEILILTFGGFNVMSGKMTVGVLFMFYSLFNMSLMPMKNIVDMFPVVEKARASAKRLNAVFSYPCENKGHTVVDTISGGILIKNISFQYGSRNLILDNLSLKISKGEKIALMGESGTGKSTLVKIILRLYDIESGEIYINGVSLNDIPIETLRKRIAYVPQKPYIFQGSLLENICVGNTELTPEEVVSCIDKTPLRSFVEKFPMGYASIVAEGGENLSGGQKQVIAIARAIIKHGDILILDEAYNSIDSNLKKIAKAAVASTYEDATCIVITHDALEAQACDRVLMINSGKVVNYNN